MIGLLSFLLLVSIGSSSVEGANDHVHYSGPSPLAWYAFNGGGSRSGINLNEQTINQTNVNKLTLLWKIAITNRNVFDDETIDSSPVFYPNVQIADGSKVDLVFFNSLRGTLFAVNAANGVVVWKQTVTVNCPTDDCISKSSPAIDPSGQYIYCASIDGYVRRYEIGTGVERKGNGFPLLLTYNPVYEQSNSPLNIINNVLYMTTSGDNHDDSWYDGHVVSLNLTSGTVGVWNALCSSKRFILTENDCSIPDRDGAGIWSRGSVVLEPLDGSLFVATGNGVFNANTGSDYYGDSLVRLEAGLPNGTNILIDSYTPSDYANMEAKDYDLGSTGPSILPTIPSSSTPYMLVQASKDAYFRLINRKNMSGQGCCGKVGGEVNSVAYKDGFIFTHPLAWEDSTGQVWVFLVSTVATGKTGFHAYKIVTSASGQSSLSLAYTLPATGTSPFFANGVLYYQTNTAVVALDPTTGKTLWKSSATNGAHWQSPIVINGKIYTADDNGNAYAWGLKQ